ncbi:hypothetical protein H9P43_008212 [Blastocladiella emersonii ATCC 22665]|nr:hypothetical protein H9P43_008212 [Blastocladiella emersonii ATCC 22665]
MRPMQSSVSANAIDALSSLAGAPPPPRSRGSSASLDVPYQAHTVVTHHSGRPRSRSRNPSASQSQSQGTLNKSPSNESGEARVPLVSSSATLGHPHRHDDGMIASQKKKKKDDGSSELLLDDPFIDAPRGAPTWISAWWSSTKLPVYRYAQIPHYLQDNENIHTGYRSGYTYAQSWRSMFFVHNETGNIWTHLAGLILFAGMVASTQYLLPARADFWDHVVFIAFLLSACKCFLFSTLFHTHFCNNRTAYIRFGCLDYAGISILICGSATIVTYYAYYCDAFWRTVYLSSLISVSFVGIVGPMFPVWPTARFRVWRTLIYIGSGVLSGLPIVHFLIANGFPDDIPWWAAYGWLVMGATYIGGAVIYAAKVPERWFPGKFDIILHSHTIWHLFVLSAALVHAYSAVDIMTWRVNQQCSVATR